MSRTSMATLTCILLGLSFLNELVLYKLRIYRFLVETGHAPGDPPVGALFGPEPQFEQV